MKHKQTFFLSFFLLLLSSGIYAQDMKEGVIKMEIVDVKTSQSDMEQMVQMMKGSTHEIHFDQDKQRIKMNMMGGLMETNMYQRFDEKEMETYMDMMGQKIKMVMDPEQIAKQEQASQQLIDQDQIKYDKSDTKDILGHKCYKAVLKGGTEGQEVQITFYISDRIAVPRAFVQNMNHLKLEGAPLEIIMDMDMMSLTYRAVEISDELADDFFEKPTGEYKEMSMEELQKMGMGGQLGF